jgi:hypothetical protein
MLAPSGHAWPGAALSANRQGAPAPRPAATGDIQSLRRYGDELGRWNVVGSLQPRQMHPPRGARLRKWRPTVDHPTRSPYTSGARVFVPIQVGDRVRLRRQPNWPDEGDLSSDRQRMGIDNEAADHRHTGDSIEQYVKESRLPTVSDREVGIVLTVDTPLRQCVVDFGFGFRRRAGRDGSVPNDDVRNRYAGPATPCPHAQLPRPPPALIVVLTECPG